MASCADSEENAANSELNLTVVSLIEKYPVLLEKSQLPGTKEKKCQALRDVKSTIFTSCGKTMDDKQILKKISNMKTSVKKKTDMNQTGNRKIVLCPWEKQLYNHLNGDENPTVTKMATSISTGFQASHVKSSCPGRPVHMPSSPQPTVATSKVCSATVLHAERGYVQFSYRTLQSE